MIKNAPFGARFLMKSGSGNEEIVTGAQITQGEGYAGLRSKPGRRRRDGRDMQMRKRLQASPRRGWGGIFARK